MFYDIDKFKNLICITGLIFVFISAIFIFTPSWGVDAVLSSLKMKTLDRTSPNIPEPQIHKCEICGSPAEPVFYTESGRGSVTRYFCKLHSSSAPKTIRVYGNPNRDHSVDNAIWATAFLWLIPVSIYLSAVSSMFSKFIADQRREDERQGFRFNRVNRNGRWRFLGRAFLLLLGSSAVLFIKWGAGY